MGIISDELCILEDEPWIDLSDKQDPGDAERTDTVADENFRRANGPRTKPRGEGTDKQHGAPPVGTLQARQPLSELGAVNDVISPKVELEIKPWSPRKKERVLSATAPGESERSRGPSAPVSELFSSPRNVTPNPIQLLKVLDEDSADEDDDDVFDLSLSGNGQDGFDESSAFRPARWYIAKIGEIAELRELAKFSGFRNHSAPSQWPSPIEEAERKAKASPPQSNLDFLISLLRLAQKMSEISREAETTIADCTAQRKQSRPRRKCELGCVILAVTQTVETIEETMLCLKVVIRITKKYASGELSLMYKVASADLKVPPADKNITSSLKRLQTCMTYLQEGLHLVQSGGSWQNLCHPVLCTEEQTELLRIRLPGIVNAHNVWATMIFLDGKEVGSTRRLARRVVDARHYRENVLLCDESDPKTKAMPIAIRLAPRNREP